MLGTVSNTHAQVTRGQLHIRHPSGGRNSSVGSAWARCPQHRGFDPPLGTKTLSDESIDRGLVCAHMHFIAQTQKILTFMSWTGECRQQKHTQHAPSTKMECEYLNGWIKIRSHTQKSHPKSGEPQRYRWGTQK